MQWSLNCIPAIFIFNCKFANAWSSAVGKTKLWGEKRWVWPIWLSLRLWANQFQVHEHKHQNSVKTQKSKNLSSHSWRDSFYCNNILLTHIARGLSLYPLITPFLKKQSTILIRSQTLTQLSGGEWSSTRQATNARGWG